MDCEGKTVGENGEVRHWKTTYITKASDPGLGAPNQGAERRCWSDAHNLTAGKRNMNRFHTWRFDPAFFLSPTQGNFKLL